MYHELSATIIIDEEVEILWFKYLALKSPLRHCFKIKINDDDGDFDDLH